MERPARPPSGGKLRIGYVSAFFDSPNWMKPVYGVINRHDRDRFEVHLVSLGGDPSAAAGYRDHAHDVIWPAGSTDDETVARRLAAAGIDVLVDLNAYSAPKSLRLFLRRPAPVQLGWFNSFATSGLDCFDGIIGDDVVIPAAEEGFYTERVLRVRGTYLAFEVLYAVPDVAPPPCSGNGGRLTFGALASAYKLNDLTLGLWARILQAAPTARLLVRAPTFAIPPTATICAPASPRSASHSSASSSRVAPRTSTFCAATIASTSRWTRSPTTAARRRPRRCGRAFPS